MNYETYEADVKKDAKFFGYETRACLLVLILIFILLMCAARGVEEKISLTNHLMGKAVRNPIIPTKVMLDVYPDSA